MKNTKKLIGILMTIVMLVSVLSVAAAAAGAGNTLYLKPNANWNVDGARFAAYYWDGNGNEGWVDMINSNSDGTYECTIPVGYPNVIFCRMNPATTENNWENKWNQSADLTVPTDSNNCYAIAEGSWDAGAWVALGGSAPEVTPAFTGYCVAGDAALCGADWDATYGANQMTLNSDGLYELTFVNIPAGDYKLKVAKYDWSFECPAGYGNDYALNVPSASNVKILFNEAANEITVELSAADPYAVTYYVAGSANLCGSEWDEDDANNAMTLNAAGKLEKVYTNVGAGTYEFKITPGWFGVEATEENPNGNVMRELDAEYAPYNLTITFDAETKAIEVFIEPVEDEEETNPGEGETNPGEGETNPGEGETNPGEGETNPGEGETNPDNGDNSAVFVMMGLVALMGMAAVAVAGKKQLF